VNSFCRPYRTSEGLIGGRDGESAQLGSLKRTTCLDKMRRETAIARPKPAGLRRQYEADAPNPACNSHFNDGRYD